MEKEDIENWLNELADQKPKRFQDFFYDDIRNFIIDNDLSTAKMKSLYQCKSKDEVGNWLDDVCSYIIIKLDTENLISEYLS